MSINYTAPWAGRVKVRRMGLEIHGLLLDETRSG